MYRLSYLKNHLPHLEYSAYLRKQGCSNPYVSFTNDYEYIYNHNFRYSHMFSIQFSKRKLATICCNGNIASVDGCLLIAVTEREVKKKCAAFGRTPPARRHRNPALTQDSAESTLRPWYTTCFVASCLEWDASVPQLFLIKNSRRDPVVHIALLLFNKGFINLRGNSKFQESFL